jgi:alpha-ketoglutarate-dependent taurine dioxygenase
MDSQVASVARAQGASAVEWLEEHRDYLDAELSKFGAVRFDGFGLDSDSEFEKFALASCGDLCRDNPEHISASHSGNVQTPVPYSASRKLLWHNENTFNSEWPMRILFGCSTAPESGGETVLADTRSVYRSLPQSVLSRFSELGITYQRTYGGGVGLGWQQIFRTEDPAEVERKCRSSDTEFEWFGNGLLRTRQTRPAIVRHPATGEALWVAQPQHWHPACLDSLTRQSLIEVLGADQLPRDCFFGDGTRIADEIMHDLCAAYQECETTVRWRAGSGVLIDNLIMAHGRNPYTGPRKILVAMGQMRAYSTLAYGPGSGSLDGGAHDRSTA